MKPVSVILFAALTLPGSMVIAEENKASVCFEGDKWYPDGQIVLIDTRAFFTCDGDILRRYDDSNNLLDGSISSRNELFVAERTSGDGSAPLYRGQILDKSNAFVPPGPGHLELVNSIEIEAVSYDIYVPEWRADEARELISKGDLPESAIYFAEQTANVPEHFLNCYAPPLPALTLNSSCSLDIRYAPNESIFIIARYAKLEGWDPNTFGGRPLSLNNVPAYVRDVHRAFSVMEEVAAQIVE